MKKKFISLNVKFFFISLVAAVIPAVFVGMSMYRKSVEIVEEKQDAAAQNFFQNISDSILMNLEYARSISLNIISNEEVRGALSVEGMTRDAAVRWQNRVIDSLYFYTGITSYTNGIYVVGHNGFEVLLGEAEAALVEDNLEEIKDQRGGAVWKWTRNGDNLNLFLLRDLRDIDSPSTSMGYLEVVVRSDGIAEQFELFLETFPGYISLWDTSGEELFSRGECLEDEDGLNAILHDESSFGRTDNNGILTYYSKVRDTQWVLVGSMRASDLFAESATIKTLFITVSLASLAICLCVVYILARMIIRPLKELTKQTKEISKDNYDIHLNIVSNDEIGILSDNFNVMAQRLDELVNEVLRDKVLQQEAQFNALQAQINPHFLYNNLDTAYWMSRMEKADKTGKILLALSRLYRSAANTSSKIISVEDEAKYAREYITIQEMRLGNQILFEFYVEESTRELCTLRFILQPLIENSIEHGILPTGDFGRIVVRIYQADGFLYFVVEDSGQGQPASEITKLLESETLDGRRGMAIRNIHQRLQIQYGPQYGLIFRQSDFGGILVMVRQPAIKYGQDQQNIE